VRGYDRSPFQFLVLLVFRRQAALDAGFGRLDALLEVIEAGESKARRVFSWAGSSNVRARDPT
jgi:hypothetical protein